MSYIGGKARGSDHILMLLNHPAFDNMDYLEPFVGYAHILRRVENKKSYNASDCNRLLVEMLKGIQQGKKFPRISHDQYDALRDKTNEVTYRRAVAAFAYSFKGGEWRGYFDKRRDRSYADEHRRYHEQLNDNAIFQKTRLNCKDYRRIHPHNKLIYCDPPYKGTTGYNGGIEFDHDEFWDCVREWSTDNLVFVSEYRAPRDFKCIVSCAKLNNLAADGAPQMRRERVFVHESLLQYLGTITRDVNRECRSLFRKRDARR